MSPAGLMLFSLNNNQQWLNTNSIFYFFPPFSGILSHAQLTLQVYFLSRFNVLLVIMSIMRFHVIIEVIHCNTDCRLPEEGNLGAFVN